MCGLAGFVDFGGHEPTAARARVKRMTDALVHRGPDEEGFYVDGHAALGHRRLSIIDLSTGQQPMGALDGQVQLVFNGEIYNFLDIRAELELLGHRFRTRSDTEVILRAYLEWGERSVDRLEGMFAFALWDARTRRVVLARDRVGKKPLYYLRRGPVLAFASELKALQAGDLCPAELDPEALDCYFSFGYIPAPKTIYRNVKKIYAAHVVTATEAGISGRQYWRLSFSGSGPQTLPHAVEEFEALLDEAVKSRLMSEVPLGAFLSGGVDSSLVVSSMARQVNRPVITNSIGFDDRRFNELPIAQATAAHLGTEHHEHVVTPNVTEVLGKIANYFDEPFADSSAVPTWHVCEMARRTVTVALSGDGGDEGFGGYLFRYLPHSLESRVRAAVPVWLRSAVFEPLGAVWPASARLPKFLRWKTIFENLAVGDAQAYHRDLVWLRDRARRELYTPDFMARLQGFTPEEMTQPRYADSDAPDALGRIQDADIRFYMTDDVLVKVDRMSMAHSLEIRCPLLDRRILEFAARLPARWKINSRRGKLVLRGLAERRLPPAVLAPAKRGFSVPAARWLRDELRPVAESTIFDRDRFYHEVLEKRVVRRMWDEHLNASRDHSVFFWGLMMLGLWEQNFYGRRAA